MPLARVRYAAWLTITANRVHGWCSLPFFVDFLQRRQIRTGRRIARAGAFLPISFFIICPKGAAVNEKTRVFRSFAGGEPLGLHLGLIAHIRHRVHGDKGLGVLTVDVFHQLLVFPLIHNGNDLTVRLQIERAVCLIHSRAAVQVL